MLDSLKRKLIVSCQASEGDPLDDLDTLCRLAASALLGGAGGLRAEGAVRVAAFRRLTRLPIIGITKAYDSNGDVHITPDFVAAASVSDAGAEMIALDCTQRRLAAAEPWPGAVRRIQRDLKRLVCADIATWEDAVAAEAAGADVVATTLCGYTADTAGRRSVDWGLVDRLVRELKVPVIVEGHVTTPEEVARALHAGAHAVVVGSAITRPQTITARFVAATRGFA